MHANETLQPMPTRGLIPSLVLRTMCLWALTTTIPICAAEKAPDSSWKPLFSGQNLDGWYTYLDGPGKNADPDRVFQVHDGVIHIYKDHTDGKAAPKGYFASDVNYSNYHLRFQYKWGAKKFEPRYNDKRDAGLLYHITGPDNVWPRCIECQVQEGDTGDCLTVRGARLQTTVDPKPVRRDEYRYRTAKNGGEEKTLGSIRNIRFIKDGEHETDGWNSVELIVRGDQECTHIVNGHPVFRAKDLGKLGADDKSWESLPTGRIAFQAECAEVFYRNIEIRPIEGLPLELPAKTVTAAASPAPAATPTKFTSAPLPVVPDGFEIELVADPPLVEYPTLACFDDAGRLYVSEGANVNDEYKYTKDTLPRSIRRLEDSDGDGKFDRYTVFADKMVFPYGGVFHEGALYVASDPSLWRLEDTDGDGVADKRDVVITGFKAMGHAACMKGGYLGPDGWMYFCGGNEGGYDLTDRDGKNLKDFRTAPCVFRIRPDGTGLEYFANGAAGVYDLTFDPSGDLFGVVTILRYPRGDGLMHWVYGGAYESSRPISLYARLTGKLLPALKDWSQTSPSGTVLYQSGAFGDEYRGNIFTAHFGTHVVTRDVIKRDGAGWRVDQEEDFAQSSDLNCRFTDVLEDADGSLLLVNTGGWFRIGCPSAEVGESDLRGAIYRVRKKGQQRHADARGRHLNLNKLADLEMTSLLGDERVVVRERAMAEFARRGAKSAPTLRASIHSPSPVIRRNCVWALTRIDDPDARAGVREALDDSDLSTVVAALHSIGISRDKHAFDQLVKLLKSKEPAIQREAATALGRLGNPSCVPALLDGIASTSDRFMEQALIFAMIEIDADKPVLLGLQSVNPKIQRGALLALDQMEHADLPQSEVARLLTSDDVALQRAVLDVIGRHRGWSKGVVEYVSKQLDKPTMSEEQRELVSRALTSALGDRRVQELVGRLVGNARTPVETRLMMLRAVGSGRQKQLPSAWRAPLRQCLDDADEAIARQTIESIARYILGNFSDQLEAVALDAKRPMPVRIEAAVAVATAGKSVASARVFDFLLASCASPDVEVVGRMSIAQALGNAQLTPAQLKQMTQTVAIVGQLELPSLVKAYEDTPAPASGKELFSALETSPGLSSLSASRVQKLIERYPASLHSSAAAVVKKFAAANESQAARMKELEFALDGGEATRGHDLFFGKAACGQCHRVGNEGAKACPDLSQIGDIRTRRDFIESIAFPSATIARGYEPVTVIAGGRTYSGIIRGESTKEIRLLTLGRSEMTIPRDDIEEILPSTVSIMPQGLDRNLTSEELRDVVAYLTTLKSKTVAGAAGGE